MSAHVSVDYRDIEWVLMQRHAKSTIMPRFTPPGWWECDVCEVTAAGYMREFEVKMSRSDFRVDAAKERTLFDGDFSVRHHQRPKENKHTLLAAGDSRGPNNFYFVAPVGLLKIEEIPVWAGFIEVSRTVGATWGYERIVKDAPRLHKAKAGDKIIREMIGASYGRLHFVWGERYTSFREQRYLKERSKAEVVV